jgi:hypothetical protein
METKIENTTGFSVYTPSGDWIFLLKLGVIAVLIYIFYSLLRKHGKKLVPLLLALILLPAVHADCGITDLGSCLPQAFFDFITGLINAPLQPFLSLVKILLEATPSIGIFQGIWAIIVYILSMFYAFLFMYSGLQFMISGLSPLKRYLAKEWLKNTILLIIFVQASFYLYGLIAEIGSIMTSATLQLVDPNYFLLTIDNLPNMGLELVFGTFYLLTLLITAIILTIRFMIVSIGVVFVPIGIFCYFIPPLKGYGKFILHCLGVFIFITFIDAIILLTSSLLAQLPLFANFKILVMLCSFLLIDLLTIILVFMVLIKSAFEPAQSHFNDAVKYIAMFAG